MNRSKQRSFISTKALFNEAKKSVKRKIEKTIDRIGLFLFCLCATTATAFVGSLLFGCLFFLPAFFH